MDALLVCFTCSMPKKTSRGNKKEKNIMLAKLNQYHE